MQPYYYYYYYYWYYPPTWPNTVTQSSNGPTHAGKETVPCMQLHATLSSDSDSVHTVPCMQSHATFTSDSDSVHTVHVCNGTLDSVEGMGTAVLVAALHSLVTLFRSLLPIWALWCLFGTQVSMHTYTGATWDFLSTDSVHRELVTKGGPAASAETNTNMNTISKYLTSFYGWIKHKRYHDQQISHHFPQLKQAQPWSRSGNISPFSTAETNANMITIRKQLTTWSPLGNMSSFSTYSLL